MKHLFGLALCVLLLLPAAVWAQTKNFNRTVPFAPGDTLRVTTDVATLRMSSWERAEVEVVARIIGRQNDNTSADYVQRAVEATRIEISGGNGAPLTIKANYDDVPQESRGNWSNRVIPRIEWEIRAPRRLNLELNADRTELADVRGFEGRHRLQTDRSPIQFSDLTGEIRLNIDRGESSQLANLRGSLTIESDRTDLTLNGVQLTGDSNLQIGRGKLELQLAGGAGLNVSMDKERRSTFKSDFPLTTNSLSENKIEGTINGGGPRLTLQTDRAQIHLRNN